MKRLLVILGIFLFFHSAIFALTLTPDTIYFTGTPQHSMAVSETVTAEVPVLSDGEMPAFIKSISITNLTGSSITIKPNNPCYPPSPSGTVVFYERDDPDKTETLTIHYNYVTYTNSNGFAFTAFAGETPNFQTLYIRSGKVDSVVSDAGWITITQAGNLYTIAINSADLPADIYKANIEISATTDPDNPIIDKIPVTLTITELPPQLTMEDRINDFTSTAHLSPAIWTRGTTILSLIRNNNMDFSREPLSQKEKEEVISFITLNHEFSTTGLTLERCYVSGQCIALSVKVGDNAALEGGSLSIGTTTNKLKYLIISDFTPKSGIQGETIRLNWLVSDIDSEWLLTTDGDLREEMKQFFMDFIVFSNPGIRVMKILKPNIDTTANTIAIVFEIYIGPDAEVGQGYINVPFLGYEHINFDFEVKKAQDPVMISTLSPLAAPAGTELIISGSNFGNKQEDSYVLFAATDITCKPAILSWSNTEIKAIVPGISAGVYEVKAVKVPDASDPSTIQESNTENFSITVEPEKNKRIIITSLSPNSAPAGTEITIIGQNFGGEQGSGYALFAATNSNYKPVILSWSNTEIKAIVPGISAGVYEVKAVKVPDASDLSIVQESNPASFNITAIVTAGQVFAYPNPFNPNSETIKLVYTKDSGVTAGIYIYNTTAKLVYNIPSANPQITWDGKDNGGNTVANGVYLVRVVDENSKALLAKGKVLVVKQ